MLNTKTILITGAPGWLGTRLVRALIHGLPDYPELSNISPETEIRCLLYKGQDANVLTSISERIKVFEGDLRDPSSLMTFVENVEEGILFHIAGVVHPKRPKEFFDINEYGTKKLLNAASRTGIKKAIVVSSNSPCGCNPHVDHLFDESSPYNPYMGYGRSKMHMEQIVQEFYNQGNIETIIIRSPWFYGPDQPPRQTLFFKMVRDGKVPVVGDGENRRSMAYVDNICHGLWLAATEPKAVGQTYWISDEKPYTMNQVIDTIEKLLEQEFAQHCAHKRMRLPNIASEIAQGMDFTLQKVGLYHQKIHVLSEMNKTIACSTNKAQNELGYKPAVSLEEGMRRSIQSCIDNGDL